MKLIHWEVDGYKSIEQGEFVASDSTILIGKNNSGKSGVVDSIIDFQRLYMSRGQEVKSSWFRSAVTGKRDNDTIQISLRFELSDSEHSQLMEKIDSEPRITSRNFAANDWLSELQIDMIIEHGKRPTIQYFVNYHGDRVELGEVSKHSSSSFSGNTLKGTYSDIIEDSFENWKFVGPFRRPENIMEVPYNVSLERRPKSGASSP
ncbi:AAA family ATPase [Halococcus agarilyticus]|uniref:hypothetical protein n=1 Tax=Halococcus agarilyticus TaxID=1232219 RepID=UPI0012ABAD43|nr:hypothetical protein [Halococcus agarilyticus]